MNLILNDVPQQVSRDVVQTMPSARQRHSLLAFGRNLLNLPDEPTENSSQDAAIRKRGLVGTGLAGINGANLLPLAKRQASFPPAASSTSSPSTSTTTSSSPSTSTATAAATTAAAAAVSTIEATTGRAKAS